MPFSQSRNDSLSTVLQVKYIVYSSLWSSMLQKRRNTHWHQNSVLQGGPGWGGTCEIILPLVIQNNSCLYSVGLLSMSETISYRCAFGEISRKYRWFSTYSVAASVKLLLISPIENDKLEKPLWVVLRGPCFIISLKLCFWLLVTGLPKFKWLEVWELLDLQGNNGKEVILWLISLHV